MVDTYNVHNLFLYRHICHSSAPLQTTRLCRETLMHLLTKVLTYNYYISMAVLIQSGFCEWMSVQLHVADVKRLGLCMCSVGFVWNAENLNTTEIQSMCVHFSLSLHLVLQRMLTPCSCIIVCICIVWPKILSKLAYHCNNLF